MITQNSIPEVKEDFIGYALHERRIRLPQFQDLGPADLVTLTKYLPTSSNTNAINSTSRNGVAIIQSPAAVVADDSAVSMATNGDASDTAVTTNYTTASIYSSSRNANDGAPMVAELHSLDKLKDEVGTFFYSMGVDTSGPTSIAIFLKEISEVISEKPQVWFGRKKTFNVARISFSTWNAFRRCDINVVVHIPGSIQNFIVDCNGESQNIEMCADYDLIWAETFVSGVVRSIMLMKENAEEGELQNLVETLILNPFTAGQIDDVPEMFIDLFPIVYHKGPLLGAPYYITNVTNTNNYLVETLVEIVKLTRNVSRAEIMLKNLATDNPEAIIILIKIFLVCDQELDAIKLTYDMLSQDKIINNTNNRMDYKSELLCIQAQFLIDKRQDYSLAQNIAQEAVNCSPSEFRPWYLLSKVYVKLNDIENALLILNSCPMSPLKEKYVLKRVAPLPSNNSLHLPLPIDVVLDEVTSLNPQDVQNEHRSADPMLVNLAASNLKSTFQLAYRLLTEIVQITGWENLLKYRSNIFVMEEEYQKSSSSLPKDVNKQEEQPLRAKRLCERWLDNLFMLLYEDLKMYTLWQTEQLYMDAQNNNHNKLTFEWELFGLCARRLGHFPEAAKAFQNGLSQRFSSRCAKKLLEYCINERQRVKNFINSPNSHDMVPEIVSSRIRELDNSIIDLCVKICCWNHRWYTEFSISLLDCLSVVIQDMSLTKVSNEISSRYPETVLNLVQENLLNFFTTCTIGCYDA
ncbi:BEM_collapsed_G0053820.mRNA.1.CDS.1 [Saccharomyces cerevisiae]|nr:BEM_HP_G0135940.mRNA.1.CDS.1 [Saccharomyces cerevisiae]CAI5016673.1 BEM_HP_G0025600.mRNA.1.CDS.1 [Saccharomyces cerevisiae]CAI5206302.1 BEM_HP_G0107850.mRNA.1.CDS.1 [Saccharomyces cerevisiae]CAI6530383.1 BEM_HP_G0135940.mRNA.1.CDS.1 [Saccharomyces cerevisiae]CAI6933838.1 BEM_HP_G0025600.mRNA.1.CDS.1 [Saccharomyces cerevisiae]